MTRDQHRRASELFDQLRDLPEHLHAAKVDAACAGDAELRAQVLRLLAIDREDNSSFLNRRAIEDAALLIVQPPPDLPSPGIVIGNYRLGARIGAGGMGIVYEAEDLRLDRRVAVKVLPLPPAAEAEERILRFQREARASSQINHPNIVSIFDAGFDRGCYYIAMEFVEGKTLRALIAAESRTIDSKTVLDWVGQTASALSAAHGAGIVHRDIKPENIMVRPDGFVKVLDFGLASIQQQSSDASSNLITRPGHVAGTIQYLSPEEVIGKPAGVQSDLFSLGVVAYELATGSRPFNGPTDGAVFDAILNRTPPPPSSIRPTLGGELDAIILRALEKDPELRFQTASDLRSSCKRLSRDSSPPHGVPAPATPPRRRLGWKAAGAMALIAIATALAWSIATHRPGRGSGPLPVQFQRLTDIPGEEAYPNLFPDGKQFVYASPRRGNWDIYLQRTGGTTPINLTRDCPQDNTQPALSPDGSRIVFRSEREGGGLFIMESTGENPRRISQRGYLPAWAPDNRHIVYSSDTFTLPTSRGAPVSRLYVIDLSSGSERRLATADAIQPNWSPHGDRIAYWGISTGGRRDIFTIATSGDSPPMAVTADEAVDWRPVWAPDGGHLYFLSNRGGTMNIWRLAIDEHSGRTRGAPEPVTVPAQYVAGLAFSSNGDAVIYSAALQRNNLFRIGFDPFRRAPNGPPEAVDPEHTVSDISFSPDGSQLVVDTVGDAMEDIWIINADGSGRRRLISDAHRNRAPQWSPDGKEVLFLSDRAGHYGIWLIRTDGSGLRPLTSVHASDMQMAIWAPDGSRVLVARYPGPPVILDPRAAEPPTNPAAPSGLEDAGFVMFRSWTAGPHGGMPIGAVITGSAGSEIVFYSMNDARLEHTHVIGRLGWWLSGHGSESLYRYFVFASESDCLLYDRAAKRQTRLFSVAPNRIYDVAVSHDERRIYFTQTVRDSDLFLARLEP